SGVEPTRSQKRTVSWRRSPVGGVASGSRTGAVAASAEASVGNRAPQPPQNLSPASAGAPHEGQTTESVAPHAVQKRRSGRFSWSQDGQRIADRLACGDYHDRVQTSERAANG